MTTMDSGGGGGSSEFACLRLNCLSNWSNYLYLFFSLRLHYWCVPATIFTARALSLSLSLSLATRCIRMVEYEPYDRARDRTAPPHIQSEKGRNILGHLV